MLPGIEAPATDPGPTSAMGSSCRIECIFFSEFHPTLGPKITYQVLSGLAGQWGIEGRSREFSQLAGSDGTQCPVLHAGTPLPRSRGIVNHKYIQTQSRAPGVAKQTNIT